MKLLLRNGRSPRPTNAPNNRLFYFRPIIYIYRSVQRLHSQMTALARLLFWDANGFARTNTPRRRFHTVVERVCARVGDGKPILVVVAPSAPSICIDGLGALHRPYWNGLFVADIQRLKSAEDSQLLNLTEAAPGRKVLIEYNSSWQPGVVSLMLYCMHNTLFFRDALGQEGAWGLDTVFETAAVQASHHIHRATDASVSVPPSLCWNQVKECLEADATDKISSAECMDTPSSPDSALFVELCDWDDNFDKN